MMANEQELLELEKGFWSLGETYFKANADRECLVAFPDMAKTMSNSDLSATVRNTNRWRDLTIDLKGMVEPGSDVVLLTYEATATRENGEPYSVLVSTGYVKRANGWKMMFHAHTPLAAKAKPGATTAGARKPQG